MTEEMQDQTITCVDCGENFLFSKGEQRYFQSKRLSTPKRCPECRAERRKRIVPAEGGDNQ